MKRIASLLLCGIFLTALAACGSDNTDTGEESVGRITLRGELTYRQRIALRPNATATVALLDAGKKGDKQKIITEVHLSDFGQVPIAFSLTFPSNAVIAGHSYKISATVSGPGGKTAWSTPTPLAIDPTDETTIHQVQLEQAGSAANRQASGQVAYQCDGMQFKAAAGRDSATLELENRLLELPSVISASGAKYSNGDTVFWSKGRDAALLELDGKTYTNCSTLKQGISELLNP